MQVGYADFIDLCQVDDPVNWMPFLKIQTDGVYRVGPGDDANLTHEERAILTEHPTKRYNEPLLPFPCSLGELEVFVEEEGLSGCIDPFDMAKFMMKEITSARFPNSEISIRHFPDALQMACDVYLEFWHSKPQDTNPAHKRIMESFVRDRLKRQVSQEEMKNIINIARPQDQKRGGAPSPERKIYKGKSREK